MAKKKAKKSTGKGPRRFILSVGDDGAILIHMEGNRVLKRMFAPSAAKEDTRHFEAVFKSDPQASIAILVDVMDQTYLQQTLPPVSALSINKLIQRRMERDFAEDDITGALPLGRTREGRRDWNYLFIAIANIPPLSEWIDYILERPQPFAGIFLLPVEAENLLERLYPAQSKKILPFPGKKKNKDAEDAQKKPAKWHIMVSHQKVGGFRQIVMKDGRLIFTRMAQPIGEPMPEVIAGNIEQELANTTEYLKRLSFNPADGLDITVIVAQEIKQAIHINNPNVRHIGVMTPHEVAERLGLQKATEENDHFGDVVFAACFAQQKKPHLSLFTKETEKLQRFYNWQKTGNMAAAVIIPGLILASLYTGYSIFGLKKDIAFSHDKYAAAHTRMAHIKKVTEELPHDINRIADVVQLYENLSEDDISPLGVVSKFAQAMGEDILVRRFEWESISNLDTARRPETLNDMEMRLNLEFTEAPRTVDDLIDYTDKFREKVQTIFPDYTVAFTKLPGRVKEDELFEVEFDNNSKTDSVLADEELDVVMAIAKPPTDVKRKRKLQRSKR